MSPAPAFVHSLVPPHQGRRYVSHSQSLFQNATHFTTPPTHTQRKEVPWCSPSFQSPLDKSCSSKKKSRAHSLAEPGPRSTGGNLAFLPHTIRQGCQLPKMFSKCSIKRDTLLGGCGSWCGERAFSGSEFQQSVSEQLLDSAPPSERVGMC